MSAMNRIRAEVREIGLVTIYFLFCFLFFLSLKKLILVEYDVRFAVLGTALISALIVAKVVVLLAPTSLGNLFGSKHRVLHVVWRSLVYTAVVFVVTLAERTFDLYRSEGGLEEALVKVWAGEDTGHFLAMNMCVGLSLLIYNLYHEIDASLGEGTLRRLLVSKGRPSP